MMSSMRAMVTPMAIRQPTVTAGESRVSSSETALALPTAAGAFIILYFIVPQINIHKTLVGVKHQRLKALVEQLDHTFDLVASEPSPENINRLRDLFQLQDIVNGKRSWAFGMGELLMLIGSVLVPLLLFMVDYLRNSSS